MRLLKGLLANGRILYGRRVEKRINGTVINNYNTKKYTPTLINYVNYSNAPAGGILVEDNIAKVLRDKFPKASFIQVNDISGGCGAMFEVNVEAPDFKGLSIVKQHKLVTSALQEHIKNMHGIRIQTTVPS